jgi:hypothetical protein
MSVLTKNSVLLCGCCGQKDSTAKYIKREIFPVYSGNCLSRKAVHIWVKNFSQARSKVAYDARQGAEVVETIVKRFLCCWESDGKSLSIMVEAMSRNNFSRLRYDTFYVFKINLCPIYSLSLVYRLEILECHNLGHIWIVIYMVNLKSDRREKAPKFVTYYLFSSLFFMITSDRSFHSKGIRHRLFTAEPQFSHAWRYAGNRFMVKNASVLQNFLWIYSICPCWSSIY